MATVGAAPIPVYNPEASFEIETREVVYRNDGLRDWSISVFMPKAQGVFPGLIAIHGGAWAHSTENNNAFPHETLAASGLVIAAVDFRTSVESPHPAAMEDINYAVRWFKQHASELRSTEAALGGLGWSSGGHQIMLNAMRPQVYAAILLPEAPHNDASLAYVAMGWPVLDPLARYKGAISGEVQARAGDNSRLVNNSLAYFGDEQGMTEANPLLILERKEAVNLPPALILQGAADLQIAPFTAERFAEAYSRAGGVIELGKYPGEPHGFMREPGSNVTRAFRQMKSFIARQLDDLRNR
jgi:acetyl esterase/lipase